MSLNCRAGVHNEPKPNNHDHSTTFSSRTPDNNTSTHSTIRAENKTPATQQYFTYAGHNFQYDQTATHCNIGSGNTIQQTLLLTGAPDSEQDEDTNEANPSTATSKKKIATTPTSINPSFNSVPQDDEQQKTSQYHGLTAWCAQTTKQTTCWRLAGSRHGVSHTAEHTGSDIKQTETRSTSQKWEGEMNSNLQPN